MTYISWFCDFTIYLEGYYMYNMITLVNDEHDLMFDLKIKVGHCDLYFMVQ